MHRFGYTTKQLTCSTLRFRKVGSDSDLLQRGLVFIACAAALTWTLLVAGAGAGILAVPLMATAAWGGLVLWTIGTVVVVSMVQRKHWGDS